MTTTYYPTYKQAYDVYASTGGGGTPAPKPKRQLFLGDSLANNVLAIVSRTIARLNQSGLSTRVVSYPGETIQDYLNSHMAEVQALVDPSYDTSAHIFLGTNDGNVYYADAIKTSLLTFCQALKNYGIKNITWQFVGPCASPYAFIRNADGSKKTGTVAQMRNDFDGWRLSFNQYLTTLVGDTLYGVADTSNYNAYYPLAQATDARYFYAAGTGPYMAAPYGNEPGGVHPTNDYGSRYPAEAAAQVISRSLGYTLNPATVTISDAPATGPTYLSSPQTVVYTPSNEKTAYVSGVFTKVSGGGAWNAGGLGNIKIDMTNYAVGDQVTLEYDQPGIDAGSIFGVTTQYQAAPTDIAKGDLCFYYD
ncbi:MAG: hypothetical protein EOO63_13480, partial [Hymenobacter sp.]